MADLYSALVAVKSDASCHIEHSAALLTQLPPPIMIVRVHTCVHAYVHMHVQNLIVRHVTD